MWTPGKGTPGAMGAVTPGRLITATQANAMTVMHIFYYVYMVVRTEYFHRQIKYK